MTEDESTPIRVRCECGAKIRAPARAIGRQAHCPKCGRAFVARPAATSTAECIRVRCECGARLAAPVRAAGRSAQCPRCGQPVAIPAPVEEEPLRVAPAEPAARIDSLLGGFTAGTAVTLPRPPAGATSVAGPSKACPSCAKSFPAGTVICVECGINIHTGQPLMTADAEHIDRVYAVAEGLIRWLSWLIPAGIYPIASEAFGVRRPWVVRGLAVVTTLVSAWFLAVFIYPANPADPSLMNLMLWCGQPVDVRAALRKDGASEEEVAAAVKALGESWGQFQPRQLLTHAFLHGGVLHLAGNLLFLMVLGSRVNALIGNILTVLLYPLLAAAAGLVHMASAAGDAATPMLGASGAIMGLAGMYLVLFPVHSVHMAAWWRWGLVGAFTLHLKLFAVRGFWVVLFYIAFDVVFTALQWEDDVAHWAHLGGFAGGIAVGTALLTTRLVNARGGDIFSALLGRYSWGLIGKPNRPAITLW